MSTTYNDKIKSAAGSREPTVGAKYNKALNTLKPGSVTRKAKDLLDRSPGSVEISRNGAITPDLKCLVEFPRLQPVVKCEPPKKKKKFSDKKYLSSPTRNATKVKKERDIDIRIARDLKFEYQGTILESLRSCVIGDIDTEGINNAIHTLEMLDIEAINDMVNRINVGATDVGNVATTVEDTVKQFSSTFAGLSDKLASVVFFTTICLACSYYLKSCDEQANENRVKACICGIIALTVMPDRYKVKMLSFITSFAEWFMPETQDASLPIGKVATLIGTALSLTIGYSKEKTLITKIADALANNDRRISGVTQLLRMIIDICSTCVNVVLESMGFDKFFIRDSDGNFQAQSFITDYNRMVSLIDAKQFDYNECNFRFLLSLCDRAQKLLIELKKSPESEGSLRIITTIYNKLLARKELFLASNFNLSGIRMEPVCILLKGKPGVGKSQMVLFLHAAICAFALTGEMREEARKDSSKFMFNRQPENVYWDGYDQKHITTVFDDFGQIRDVAGNPDCEYMNIIRAVNEFPAMLHTAAMEKKSNTFFRSDFVIATTNMERFKPESIICHDALTRRFHICYEVQVLPEFATEDGKIDVKKLKIDADGNPIYDPNIVVFVPYDYNVGGIVGSPVSFYEFVDVVRNTWLEHKRRNSVKIHNIDNVMDNVISRYTFQSGFLSKIGTVLSYFDPRDYDESDLLDVQPQEDYGLPLNEALSGLTEPEDNNWIFIDDAVEDLEKIYGFDDLFQTRFAAWKRDFPLTELRGQKACLRFYDTYFPAHNINSWRSKFVAFPNQFHEAVMIAQRAGLLRDRKLTLDTLFSRESLFSFVTNLPRKLEHKFENGFERYCNMLNNVVGFLRSHGCSVVVATVITSALQGVVTYGAMSLAGAASAKVTKTVKGFFGNKGKKRTKNDDDPMDIQMYGMKKPNAQQKAKSKFDFKALQQQLRGEHQSYFGADTNGAKIVDKITSRNLYRIYADVEDTRDHMGYGLMLRGTSMLFPQHFAYQIASFISNSEEVSDCFVTFELACKGEPNPAHSFKVTFPEFVAMSETDIFEGRDLAIAKLPIHVPMHQDIVDYFLSDSDYERIMDWNVRLIIAKPEQRENICSKAVPITQPIPVAGTDDLEPTFITKGFRMHGLTTKGDCGSPMAIVNNRMPKARFIGLHTAGVVMQGIAITCSVSREELQAYFNKFPDIIEEIEPEEYDTFDPIAPQSQFKPLYKTPLVHNTGSKTMIARSEMYGYNGEVKTAPAVLRPVYRDVDGKRILVDPYLNAIKKYCTPYVHFDQHNVNMASLSVLEMLRRTSKPFRGGIYPFDIAIKGDPDDEFFGSMSRSTSAGYPYCSKNLGRGKYPFFGYGDEFDLTTPMAMELRAEVEDIIEQAISGVRKHHIFTDNLKDERRPLEKVEAVKTRLFSGAPLAYTVAFRMYFGRFMAWYIGNNISNGSAIGLNVFGLDWDLLAKKLAHFSNPSDYGFGAGDFSGFDGSEKPAIHWAILNIINELYDDGPINQQVRKILWYDLVNSKHIREDSVFAWPSSLPSGHPCTTIANNLYNHISFNLCWIQLGLPVFGPESFYERVYLVTMGDDNLYSVHPKYRDCFNEFAVSREMAKLGLTYTSEIKGEHLHAALRKLNEVSFLKRSFRWDSSLAIWVAPIELDVILDIPNWTKRNDDMRDAITTDNVEVALMELSLHGKDTYAQYAPCMLKAYRECGLTPLKYETFDANVLAIHNRLRYL